MKQLVLSALMLLSIEGFTQKSSDEAISRIEDLVKEYALQNDIPTINVGVVLLGKTHFINYGIDNRSTKNQTSENSIFQIASVGKVLTGIVLNQLIQQGELDIDEPFLTYLPQYHSKKVNSKLKTISVRDLLHHRSGFPRQSKIINRKNDEPIIYDYKATDFEKDFEKMKLEKAGAFSYSNFGYAVLGYIAEMVSGSSFEELLAGLSKKYGMVTTSTYCKNTSLLVTPYDEDNRSAETKIWELGKLSPPSGLYSSVSDLTQLLNNQLATYKDNDLDDILFLTKDTRSAWEGTGISYGYGLFDWGNGEFGHGGAMDGFGSEYWFNPKENVGFVLLTSSGGKWVIELSKAINGILSDMN